MEGNTFLGIIGALFGALIGSALWILIGQFGFIAGIAGYVIVLCSVKGYELLGRAVTRRGIIICVIFSLLMILAAEYFSLGITIYKEFNKYYSITVVDAFKAVPTILKEPKVMLETLKDLVVGYGLAIWASFSFVRNLWRRQTGGNF